MVPAVIGVETRMGAQVAGELAYAAKLLNVSRLPLPSVPEPVRRALNLPDDFAPARGYEAPDQVQTVGEEQDAPLPMRPRVPIPGPIKVLLNRSLAALDGALSRGYGTDRHGQNLEVHEVDTFDESFDELFEKVAAVVPCVPEKDSSFLRWRYGPGSPQYPVKVLAVRGGPGLLGYAVLKMLHTGEDGFLMDLTVLPGQREAARALLRESVRYFRKNDAHIIRYRYLPSPTSPSPDDLRRFGYFHRKGGELAARRVRRREAARVGHGLRELVVQCGRRRGDVLDPLATIGVGGLRRNRTRTNLEGGSLCQHR